MMAARKSRSVSQLLSRGPLAAPTLLQGAAFFIGQRLSAKAQEVADLNRLAAANRCPKIRMG
jgi:hypothetical protein